MHASERSSVLLSVAREYVQPSALETLHLLQGKKITSHDPGIVRVWFPSDYPHWSVQALNTLRHFGDSHYWAIYRVNFIEE